MSYWFNELPSDWNVVKVKNVFNMISGGTPKSDIEEYWSDSEVIWVTPEDLSKEGKYLNDSIRKISNLGLQNCSANVIKANSIVVSTRAPIGNVKVSTVPFTTNQGCKSLEAKGKVNITYYYYVIALAKEHLNNLGQGTTFLELSNYSLKNVFVPYPDINSQDLIAYYLDTKCNQIDELIVAKKKQISLLEQQRQSIITEAVTKGLNPNVKMKDSGVEWIGEIPEHWEEQKIKYLFFESIERNFSEDATLLSLFTSIGVKPRRDMEEKGNKAQTVINYKVVRKGDIVVNKLLAWMGAIGLSEYNGVTSPDYDVYRSLNSARIEELYYHYYFRNHYFKGDCFKFGRGIMMMRWRTYPEQFKSILVPVPSKEEQTQIANYIETKEKELALTIKNIEHSIHKLKEYRQALIYEAVTGKIDVRDMELDEVR
ncbi:restriction endonuclease subunit S [Bacillus pumilus]|uniref:restriction endonuclease subunit S n=1 Tax=Bacillus pumilus TaxID=1408 RepID=UPI003B66F158